MQRLRVGRRRGERDVGRVGRRAVALRGRPRRRRSRAQERACSFLPAATTNSTSTVAFPDPREHVVLVLAVGPRASSTSERASVNSSHGNTSRMTSSGSRIQKPFGSTCVRCASNASRRLYRKSPTSMSVVNSSVRLASKPRSNHDDVRALLAALLVRRVQRLHPCDRPRHEVELQRLPRLAGFGVRLGIAREIERGHRDLVHADVIGMRIEVAVVAVRDDHLRTLFADDLARAGRPLLRAARSRSCRDARSSRCRACRCRGSRGGAATS